MRCFWVLLVLELVCALLLAAVGLYFVIAFLSGEVLRSLVSGVALFAGFFVHFFWLDWRGE